MFYIVFRTLHCKLCALQKVHLRSLSIHSVMREHVHVANNHRLSSFSQLFSFQTWFAILWVLFLLWTTQVSNSYFYRCQWNKKQQKSSALCWIQNKITLYLQLSDQQKELICMLLSCLTLVTFHWWSLILEGPPVDKVTGACLTVCQQSMETD